MSKIIVNRDFNGADASVFGFQARGTELKDVNPDYLEVLKNLGFVKEFQDGEDVVLDPIDSIPEDESQPFSGEKVEDVVTASGDEEAGDKPVADIKVALEAASTKDEIKKALASREDIINELAWNKSIANIKEEALKLLDA
jgi:hypothetical protein